VKDVDGSVQVFASNFPENILMFSKLLQSSLEIVRSFSGFLITFNNRLRLVHPLFAYYEID